MRHKLVIYHSQLSGEYGLRNKREVWRVKFTLAKIRKAARELLTLDEKDPKRLFEGTCPPACILPSKCWPMILMNLQIACGVMNSSSMRPFSITSVNVQISILGSFCTTFTFEYILSQVMLF